jgi:hypothetical protein
MAHEPLRDQKPHGYWKDKANVIAETLEAAKRLGHPTLMPSEDELREIGLSSLAIAITKEFAGFPRFATECGLIPRRVPNGYFDEISNLCSALRAYANANNMPGVMPTTDALKKSGDHSLVGAIAKHGGVLDVATACSLAMSHDKKPSGHYNDFATVAEEIHAFIERTQTWGTMPCRDELCDAGESGLGKAIADHGGFPAVATRLGLAPRRKPNGYWTDERIDEEVSLFVSEYGEPGVFPTGDLLRNLTRADLDNAINRSEGGARAIAHRLGLTLGGGRENGYWEREDNLRREVLGFIEHHGEPGMMPTQKELIAHERWDIVNALHRVGGGQAQFAQSLGLQTRERPKGYWQNFDNLRDELVAFISMYGQLGQMPSPTFLREMGYASLLTPINDFGGFFVVAERLGWSSTNATLWPRSEIEICIAHEIQSVVDFDLELHKLSDLPGRPDCDIVIPDLSLIVEFDSWKWHHGVDNNGVDRLLKDQTKSESLRNAGWKVIRIREKPLALTHAHDVVVAGTNLKAHVDAVVRRMQEIVELPKDSAHRYLSHPTPRRTKEAREYIEQVLRTRRGEPVRPDPDDRD